MPHLVVRESGQVAFSVPLGERVQVGRNDQNDVVIRGNKASRQHAAFERRSDGFFLRDLGSRHGTLVNGIPAAERLLRDGDCVQIGDALLSFFDADEPGAVVHRQPNDADAHATWSGETGRRLQLVSAIARAMGALDDTEEILGRLLVATLGALGCARGVIGLGLAADDGSSSTTTTQLRPGGNAPMPDLRRIVRGESTESEIIVRREVIETMLSRLEGVVVRDPLDGDAVSSGMGVPLVNEGQTFGFLYVDDRIESRPSEARERFTHEDLALLFALGQLMAAATRGADAFQRSRANAEALVNDAGPIEIVGRCSEMDRVRGEIERYAASPRAFVLIRGEAGSGKQLVARALHKLSARADHPFVVVDCASTPESEIEGLLFGYDREASGSVNERRGKLLLANRGTLFLHEVGGLGLPAQAKLLRALQDGEIQPLGGDRAVRIDVRVLASTRKDLVVEAREKRFREDLYHRLAVAEIAIPPLREREGDVELLANHFLARAAIRVGKPVTAFSPNAIAAFRRHLWGGNVRELANEVERAVIIAETLVVDVGDLSHRVAGAATGARALDSPITLPSPGGAFQRSLAERFAELEPLERQLIEEAMKLANGNITDAARMLGITRIMMKRRLERFQIGDTSE